MALREKGFGSGDRATGGSLFRPIPSTSSEDGSELAPLTEFDEDAAEAQRLLQRYDTQAQVGEDYAAAQREQVRQTAIDTLNQVDRSELSADEYEQLSAIAQTGQKPVNHNFLIDILDGLDRLGGLVRLGITDVAGHDEEEGNEIRGRNYLDVLLGRKHSLVQDVGAEVVGEDGRVSGGAILDNMGWDEEEDWFGKIGRGVADFSLEVLADPLTYVTFGLSAVGKKAALEAAEATAGRFVRRALAAEGPDALESGFLRSLRTKFNDDFAEILAKKEDDLIEKGLDLNPEEMLRIREEAIEEATFKANADLANDVGQKVADREFGQLSQDFVDEVLKDPDAPNWLVGGMRAVLPKVMGGRGVTGGAVIPGTRGLGRKTTNALFRNRGWYNTVKDSGIGRTLRSIKNNLAGEQAQLAAARAGRLHEFSSGVEEWKRVASELGLREITTSLGADAHRIAKLANDAGEDVETTLRQLLHHIESRQAPVGKLFASDELDKAARNFIGGSIDALDEVYATMKRYDPDLGEINRYVPRIFSDEGMKAMKRLAEDAVAVDTSTVGGQLLSQYLAKFGEGARGTSNIGEAVYQQSREIGQSALVPAVNDSRYMLLDRGMIESNYFPSIDEMNRQLSAAIKKTVDDNNINVRLGDDFALFDNDPLNLLTKYFQGMGASLEQRVLVSQWRKVGLIRGADRAVDLQRINSRIAEHYFEDGGMDRLLKFVDDVERRVDDLVGGDIPKEAVDLGNGVKMNIPEGVQEVSARLRQAINTARRRVEKATERYDDILRQRERTFAQLTSQGVSEEMARELAHAQPDELSELLDVLWSESITGLDEEVRALTERLAMESGDVRRRATETHQAAIDHAAQVRREVSDARRQMRREWNDRYRDRSLELPTEDFRTVMFGQAERQTLAGLLNRKAGEITMRGLDDLFAEFPEQLVSDMKRGLLENDQSLILETRELMRDWLVDTQARRDSEWIGDLFGQAVEAGMDPDVLPNERTLRRLANGETETSRATLEVVGRAVIGLEEGVFETAEQFVARNDYLRDEFRDLMEAGGRSAEDVYRQVARDGWIAEANTRLRDRAWQANTPIFNMDKTINGLTTGIQRVTEALTTNPRLFQSENIRNEFFGLLHMLPDVDPTAFEILADGSIRYSTHVTSVGAEFPTINEIHKALKDADINSVREAMGRLDELPDNIAQALTHDGVPEHIAAHSQLTRAMADARSAERRAGSAIRGMDRVNEAQRLWDSKVLPKVRAVFNGDAQASSLRKLFYTIDKADNTQRLTDLGKQLKAGLPGEVWDRITNMARHLEAVQDTRVDRSLLAQNKALMEGRVFQPLSESVQRAATWADRVKEGLDGEELARLTEHLDNAQEFIDTMMGEFLGKAARQSQEVVFPYQQVLASDRDIQNLSRLRTLARKLGFSDDDVEALKPLESTLTTEGFRPVRDVGVGGEIVQGSIARPEVNLFFENMASNMRRSYTPEGLDRLGKSANSFLRGYWKGAATVARPTFHIRNIIGAVWNNQIVDVGAREYARLGGYPTKFLRALRQGADIDEALERVPQRLHSAFRAMVKEGVFESSFSTEFRRISSGSIENASNLINPLSEDFMPFRVGGAAMESIEAQARAAVFIKYFDEANPETASYARSMVNAVHFDYNDLTGVEQWVKQVVPFFVWTRRNIPLQLQTMLERPGIAMRYPHLAHATEDQWEGDVEADRFAASPYLSGYAARTGVVLDENSPFWARLLLDPDIPLKNIMEEDPLSWEGVFNLVTSSLGPQFTTPFQLREQAEYGDVNAPHGMKEILMAFGADTTNSGDVRIPYAARSVAETIVPFAREYTGLTAGETDPRRRQRAGLSDNDGWISQVLSVLGSGAGVTWQTPSDTLGQTYEADQYVQDLKQEKKFGGLNLETTEDAEKIVEEILANIEAGELGVVPDIPD